MDELRSNVNDLAIAVSAIPEMKEDLKELVRALRGNNGNVGVIGRLKQVEDVVESTCMDYTEFKRMYNINRKEDKDFINHKFDTLTERIVRMNQERIDKLEEEEDAREQDAREREQDARDRGKDFRKFFYGLGAGLIPQVVEWIISLFN